MKTAVDRALELIKKWGPRLGLEGWQITVTSEPFEANPTSDMLTVPYYDTQRADIKLNARLDVANPGFEECLVHELLHVRAAAAGVQSLEWGTIQFIKSYLPPPIAKAAYDSLAEAEERMVYAFARVLIDMEKEAHRGKKRSS